jgi:hypothetical protein
MSKAIYRLQQGAWEAGYYGGRLDGEWSPELSAALARMMIARGEPLDPAKPFNGLQCQPENSGS